MNMPTVVHPRVYEISGVQIQLVTFFALTEAQAQSLARFLWTTQAAVRKKKGKRYTAHWTGTPEVLALLPVR